MKDLMRMHEHVYAYLPNDEKVLNKEELEKIAKVNKKKAIFQLSTKCVVLCNSRLEA
uniref:Uncharacterized protein n=1 Tax=uncultured prokaryote TaxID=198431 RepID=A0A0H5PXM9_9ZZZZ|nr:unnamed protein product [uncultured bacterium]CRY93929.1 hypothetical protein [uncultured prokaryote]